MATATPRSAAARKTSVSKPTAKPTSRVPAGAKKPTDHKPGAEQAAQEAEAAGDTTRTVEVDGVQYTIDLWVLDDYDLMKAISQNNYLPALDVMFTPAEVKKIVEARRDPETGRVKYSDIVVFVERVYQELAAGNS